MISLVIVSCILIISERIIIHDNAFMTFYIGLATGNDFTILLGRFVELSVNVFQNNSSLLS